MITSLSYSLYLLEIQSQGNRHKGASMAKPLDPKEIVTIIEISHRFLTSSGLDIENAPIGFGIPPFFHPPIDGKIVGNLDF